MKTLILMRGGHSTVLKRINTRETVRQLEEALADDQPFRWFDADGPDSKQVAVAPDQVVAVVSA